VHDAVECGRASRVMSVVDADTRECLALEDTSIGANARLSTTSTLQIQVRRWR
jgi:hypothetical protein